jgi:ATP-dependent DNA ligase
VTVRGQERAHPPIPSTPRRQITDPCNKAQGKLIYAGRAGTGMAEAELERLWQRLQPLMVEKMPLAEPPTRGTRFGSPLVLSRVHWVRPEMVVEVTFVEWTPDGLLRHVVYLGERDDKMAVEVRRSRPHTDKAYSR